MQKICPETAVFRGDRTSHRGQHEVSDAIDYPPGCVDICRAISAHVNSKVKERHIFFRCAEVKSAVDLNLMNLHVRTYSQNKQNLNVSGVGFFSTYAVHHHSALGFSSSR